VLTRILSAVSARLVPRLVANNRQHRQQQHSSAFLAMRLLNTSTLRLESFFDSEIPEYAILSHTWGKEEVLFDDIHDTTKTLPVHKKGFAKVQGSCDQARRDGYGYIWIDTCCIDKSSSAELSEAINSMFQ
jgi:hypothetical protein